MIRYPTGIAGLDRELGGGIDPGTLVTIETDSTGQGDTLLRHLATQQPTLYISTTRAEKNVEEWLQNHPLGIDPTHIDVRYTGVDRKAAAIDDYLEGLVTPVNVIVDPVNGIRPVDEAYTETLHRLKSRLRETGRIGYLHVESLGGDGARTEDLDHTATYRASDMVWKLFSEVTERRIATLLAVTKRRGHATPEKPLELDIGTEITVETSRDIYI